MRIAMSGGIRARLVGVFGILFAILLALAWRIHDVAVQQERDAAMRRASEFSRQLASRLEQQLQAAQGVLLSAAAIGLDAGRPTDCSTRLASLRSTYPVFRDIVLLAPSGAIECAAGTGTGGWAERSQEWWLNEGIGLQEGTQAVSNFLRDRGNGAAVVIAQTLPGSRAQAGRVLLAPLDLDYLHARLADRVPSDITVRVLDRNGIFMLRHPDPACCVGRSGANLPGVRSALAEGEPRVHLVASWLDGNQRMQADVPIGRPAWAVLSVGLPPAYVSAATQGALLDAVAMLVGALILTATVVWLGAERVVLAPLRRIGAAARRMRGGELGARVATDGLARELGSLGREFNDMGEALAAREHSLNESREHLHRVIDTCLDAIISVDATDRVLEWNAEAERMFGIPRQRAIGAEMAELIVPPELRAAHREGMSRVAAGREPRILGRRIETTAVRADGTRFAIELSVVKLHSGSGPAFGAFVRDISQRKRAEEELRVAATAFEAQEGIMITDAQCRILRVNQAFSRITGFEPEAVVGKTPAVLRSGRHDTDFYRDLWAKLERDGLWEGEIWNRRRDGEVYPEWLAISAVRAPDGAVTHYVGTFTDISRRKEAEEQIRTLAFFDPLTCLPNRRMLVDRLQHALASGARRDTHGAALFIDLDHFKQLNDSMGHDVGDLLLKQVAARLRESVREEDTVARLGGDEFVVMIEGLSQDPAEAASHAEALAEKVRVRVAEPYALCGRTHHTTPSIGVCLFRGREFSVDEILRRADAAMYEAKGASRNNIRFFDPALQAAIEAKVVLQGDLRAALAHSQFELFYQVQVDREGRAIGAETLLRWRHPSRGMVSPADFIPIAEETGLIVPIGQWVIERACRQLEEWRSHPQFSGLTLAVNVSARQFRQKDFVECVERAIATAGARPERMKLELTETLVLEDIEDTVQKMNRLRALGVGLSMDDFGTGHSSLANLRRLPLEQLKIDRSFVRDIETDPNDAMIVQTIIGMANNLGLKVIAEGVETEAQREFLDRNGCYALQGYLLGRPVPVDEFERLAVTRAARSRRALRVAQAGAD